MALAMSRPWKHPKTGVYWLRKRIPTDLAAVLRKIEVKHSLGTKDPHEAKKRHAIAIEQLEKQWANLRSGTHSITSIEAHSIANIYYHKIVEHHKENPRTQVFWRVDLFDKLFLSQSEMAKLISGWDNTIPDWWYRICAMEDWCKKKSSEIAVSNGLVLDDESVDRMNWAVANAAQRAALHLKALSEGYIDRDFLPGAQLIEALTQKKPADANKYDARKAFHFSSAVELWISEKQPAAKTVYEWKCVMSQLEQFLGHADASKVSSEDLLAWKSQLLALGRKPKTIRDAKIAPVRAILQCAVNNHKIDANPAERIVVALKRRPLETRRGFTDQEAKIILRASLKAHDSVLHWVPFLCAYTGARVSEVCQLRAQDFYEQEGLWCLHFAAEAGSLKNSNSERALPLHPALIQHGVLDFIETVGDGPIFAELPPDSFGKRGGTGTKVIGRFVRGLGLTDTRLGPNHSWRHRFKTQSRIHGLALDVVNAITGHKTRSVADSYGEFPMSALYRELIKIPILNLQ